MLAVEVNNSAKVTLLSFSRTIVFLYDGVGKWRSWSDCAVGAFAWLIQNSDCRLELQAEWSVPADGHYGFRRRFDFFVQQCT